MNCTNELACLSLANPSSKVYVTLWVIRLIGKFKDELPLFTPNNSSRTIEQSSWPNDTYHNYACKYVTPRKDIYQIDTTKWQSAKQNFTRMKLGIFTLANMSHLKNTFTKVTQQNDTEKENFTRMTLGDIHACKYVTPCKDIHQIDTTK